MYTSTVIQRKEHRYKLLETVREDVNVDGIPDKCVFEYKATCTCDEHPHGHEVLIKTTIGGPEVIKAASFDARVLKGTPVCANYVTELHDYWCERDNSFFLVTEFVNPLARLAKPLALEAAQEFILKAIFFSFSFDECCPNLSPQEVFLEDRDNERHIKFRSFTTGKELRCLWERIKNLHCEMVGNPGLFNSVQRVLKTSTIVSYVNTSPANFKFSCMDRTALDSFYKDHPDCIVLPLISTGTISYLRVPKSISYLPVPKSISSCQKSISTQDFLNTVNMHYHMSCYLWEACIAITKELSEAKRNEIKNFLKPTLKTFPKLVECAKHIESRTGVIGRLLLASCRIPILFEDVENATYPFSSMMKGAQQTLIDHLEPNCKRPILELYQASNGLFERILDRFKLLVRVRDEQPLEGKTKWELFNTLDDQNLKLIKLIPAVEFNLVDQHQQPYHRADIPALECSRELRNEKALELKRLVERNRQELEALMGDRQISFKGIRALNNIY